MTTLSKITPLLDRLFEADAAAKSATMAVATELSNEEMARMMRGKTEYLELYRRFKDFPLAVSRKTGTLLYMLARNCNAQTIVEFGTSFGLSTLHLAAALRDNGGGRLITSEFEPSKVAQARQNLTEGRLIDLVEIREGDALHTLGHNLPANIDMLFLDGAKGLYTDILDLLEIHLRPGALIIADDADKSPDYLAHVRSATAEYISVALADDIELSMRIG